MVTLLCGVMATLALSYGIRLNRELRESSEGATHLLSRVENLQAELTEHQAAVDLLADGLNVAIFICDIANHVIYANVRAKELFRFDAPRGRSLLAVTLSHDLDRLAKLAVETEAIQSQEILIKERGDKMIQAVAWMAGQNSRIFLSLYEVTELRRLERIRQDFVANVSHELRTPLTIIRAMAETLAEDPKLYKEKGTDYLARIMSEVDRLSLISNDLLILSSAESNPVRKLSCNIVGIWKHALTNLSEKADAKGIQLSYVGPDSLTIEANETQMTQVAMNLVENAINYSTAGTVVVEIEHTPSDVQISVKDTGIGIASEHLERIFERFYRVDKARSRGTGSTGLGLSIVKHIVESHGGSVKVVSQLNEGSTFTVTLPSGNSLLDSQDFTSD